MKPYSFSLWVERGGQKYCYFCLLASCALYAAASASRRPSSSGTSTTFSCSTGSFRHDTAYAGSVSDRLNAMCGVSGGMKQKTPGSIRHRSEERRVGKEWRSRRSAHRGSKKESYKKRYEDSYVDTL